MPRVFGAQVREYLVALGARQEYAQERDRKPRERSERVHVRAPREDDSVSDERRFVFLHCRIIGCERFRKRHVRRLASG